MQRRRRLLHHTIAELEWPNLKVINPDRVGRCAFCVLKVIGLGQCPADIKTGCSGIDGQLGLALGEIHRKLVIAICWTFS